MLKKLLASLSIASTVLLGAVFLTQPAASAGQASGRLIRDTSITIPVAPPVRLKGIKMSGRRVEAGRRFDAPDNWLDGLSADVENLSEKNIERLQLEFIFPAATPDESALLVPVSYGKVYSLSQPETASRTPVGPGVSVNFALASKAAAIREELARRRLRGDVVNIRLARVEFDDGTGWALGRNTRRDAENPLRWNILYEEEAAALSAPALQGEVSFKRASFDPSATTKTARRVCFRWNYYDIIPCDQCGDTIVSENFETCRPDSNCDYKPYNTMQLCAANTSCANWQYKLVSQLCNTWDEE